MNGGNFTDMLQEIIERKKISRRELANGTGLGETVYKYVKGTRKIPEMRIVDRLADYLQCTPPEKEALRQAWRLETYGPQRLERWKQLDQFFAHYSLDLSAVEGYSFYINIQKDTKPYLFLHSGLEVQQAMLALLDDCARSRKNDLKKNGIGEKSASDLQKTEKSSYSANGLMRIQPDQAQGGVYAVIQSGEDKMLNLLRFAEQRSKNLNIRHIFCLPPIRPSKTDEVQERTSYNKEDVSLLSLKYLQAVIPLTLESPYYESRYYYSEQSDSEIWPLSGSFLMSDRYAVIFGNSKEGKSGIFSSDPELLRFLKRTFHRVYLESRPFLKHADSYEALLNTYYSPTLLKNKDKWFSYSEQPCLCPYLTPVMVEKYIHKEAPSELKENFVASITWYRENQLTRVEEYSRLSGILRFLTTGRMDEIPKELYDPLSIEDRLTVLDAWLKDQEKNPTQFLRWNDEENSRLSVHFFPNKELSISFYAEELFCTFSTEERNLLESFDDYFEHIEADQVLTEEEVKKTMERMRKACGKDN